MPQGNGKPVRSREQIAREVIQEQDSDRRLELYKEFNEVLLREEQARARRRLGFGAKPDADAA